METPQTSVEEAEKDAQEHFGFRDSLKKAWGVFVGNWQVMVATIAILFIIGAIDGALGAESGVGTPGVAQVIVSLLATVANLLIGIAFVRIVLNIIRGKSVNFSMIFEGHKPFMVVLRYIGVSIILMLLFGLVAGGGVFAAVALGGVSGSFGAGALVGFVATILTIFFALRLAFVPYVMIDKEATIGSSLATSWYMTQGRIGMMIKFYILMTLVVLAGAIVFIVGLIVAIPVAMIIFALLYDHLLSDYARTQKQEK